nr:hypothetical protein [Candidatus Sigynarchaeum springense]
MKTIYSRPSRYRFIASPVRKSFLHAMQYSPLASRNVMVDPALHQGQLICFSCFTTRMLVIDPHPCDARRGRHELSKTYSMGTAGYLSVCVPNNIDYRFGSEQAWARR